MSFAIKFYCDGENCKEWVFSSENPEAIYLARRQLFNDYGWIRRFIDGELVDLCRNCAKDLTNSKKSETPEQAGMRLANG